ncbi:MAG: hypothetical protein WC953_02655 [Pseudomonas sp.]
MTGIPGESTPESGDAGGQEQRQQSLSGELKSSLEWLEHAALAGADLVRLAGLELRLAAGDSGRLLALGLAMVPLALLAWIGLSVLLGWLVFIWLGSEALAIVTFIVVQLVAMGVIAAYCRTFAKSLSFPATSRQLKALKEQIHGAQGTGKTDQDIG